MYQESRPTLCSWSLLSSKEGFVKSLKRGKQDNRKRPRLCWKPTTAYLDCFLALILVNDANSPYPDPFNFC